jgi:hypothetical protein
MNRKITITLFLIFAGMMVFDGQATCQVRDVAEKKSIGEYMLSITYEYVFAIDTVSSIRKTDLEKLEIGLEMSRYYSVFADRCDSVMYKYRIENPNTERGVNEQAWMKDFQQAIYDDYYLNYPGEGILTSRQRIVPMWSMNTPSLSRNLNGGFCRTLPIWLWAIGAILPRRPSGVETTVFHSPHPFPFPNGPWKFNGTPGLILKAEETDRIIQVGRPSA